MSLPITLPTGEVLDGNSPVVILGPNGVGKTRYAASLCGKLQGELIVALRNMQVRDIQMQTIQESEAHLRSAIKERLASPWSTSSEMNLLLAKLKADDTDAAIKYRDEAYSEVYNLPEQTNLKKLTILWGKMFPGRKMDLSSYKPLVRVGASGGYSAATISGGERVALYLAARVLNAQSGILFIDEPEIHFHSQLAKIFWDTIEQMRPDCRFVYITHDLPFAVSRRDAQFIIVKSISDALIVPDVSQIPDDIVESILGAASFSIYAKRIVFCEGDRTRSLDANIYTAWFDNPETIVVPVGGCQDVVKCTEAFNRTELVRGVTAIGIIDKDYWSDDFFESLPAEVRVLRFHEIENLLCIKEAFKLVGEHLGKSGKEVDSLYERFIEAAKSTFRDEILNRQILERVKRRVEREIQKAMNLMRPARNLDQLKTDFIDSIESSNWPVTSANLFQEERDRITTSLSGSANEFLELFPGKTTFGLACQNLGIEKKNYISLVCKALSPENTKVAFKRENVESLINVLEGHLGHRNLLARSPIS